MMRPLTVLCMLMAAGSGLYLYQAKHHAEVESQQIEHVLSQANAVRQRIAVLVTDYQLENNPERLRDLTTKFVANLRPTEPPQFTSMADLDKRLPAVSTAKPDVTAPLEPDAPAEPASAPVAPIPMAKAEPPNDAAKPQPPKPALAVALATEPAARSPAHAPPAPIRQPSAIAPPVIAASGSPAPPRLAAVAPFRPAPLFRPAPYSAPVETPVASSLFSARAPAYRPPPTTTGGSMLGMARTQQAVSFTAFAPFGSGG